MDKLYAKLSEQHSIMQQQKEAVKLMTEEALYARGANHQPSCSSLPLTPAVEAFPAPAASTTRSASATPGDSQSTAEEVLRLKLELAQAQNKISRLDQELAHTRINSESGCATPALGPEHDFVSAMAPSVSPTASRASVGPMNFNAPMKMPPFSREHSWMTPDDTPAEIGDSLPPTSLNRPRGIWNNNKPAIGSPYPQGQVMMDGTQPMPWSNNRAANYEPAFAPSGMDMYRQDRMVPDQDMRPVGRRGNRYDNRYGSSNNFGGGFNSYGMVPPPYEAGQSYSGSPQQPMIGGGMGLGLYSPYQQQTAGTSLSPHATEFTSIGSSWKGEVSY